MNSFVRWTGAFAGVAVVAFLVGFFLQMGKISSARTDTETCMTNSIALRTIATRDAALVSLFRARHELARNNFGTAGEHLSQAKVKVTEAGITSALPHVDKASAAVLAQDLTTATDPIQEAIKAIDSAPATPAAVPAPK